MQSTIQWQGQVAFTAQTGSGHTLHMDGPPEYGGNHQGARPMELILSGLGGCAAFDVVTILQKARQAITDVRCELTAKRADAVPAVFTDIHLHFIVAGHDLKAKQIEKAIALSAEKYCSASQMLSAGGVNITHDFEMVELGA